MNARNARLLTRGLAIACAGLAALAGMQYAGLGRGYHWAPEGSAGEATVFGKIDEQTVELPPRTAFAQIEAHPLFNPDRQPTEAGEGAADAMAAEDAAPTSPLTVALTGIIVDEAHGVRIAMLQDQARNQAVALRVGMPLEGDQSAWTLVEVHPRKVVFRNPADETAEIELETAAPPPVRRPPPARGRPAPQPRGAGAGTAQEPATADPSAVQPPPPGAQEDLARRIEERRRQMREEALKEQAVEQETNGAGNRGPNETVTE